MAKVGRKRTKPLNDKTPEFRVCQKVETGIYYLYMAFPDPFNKRSHVRIFYPEIEINENKDWQFSLFKEEIEFLDNWKMFVTVSVEIFEKSYVSQAKSMRVPVTWLR